LRGFVRNLEDGRVEVVATGDRRALDRFRSVLEQGPPSARVDSVSEAELSTEEDWHSFDIK
jgi:acylphosphatase